MQAWVQLQPSYGQFRCAEVILTRMSLNYNCIQISKPTPRYIYMSYKQASNDWQHTHNVRFIVIWFHRFYTLISLALGRLMWFCRIWASNHLNSTTNTEKQIKSTTKPCACFMGCTLSPVLDHAGTKCIKIKFDASLMFQYLIISTNSIHYLHR